MEKSVISKHVENCLQLFSYLFNCDADSHSPYIIRFMVICTDGIACRHLFYIFRATGLRLIYVMFFKLLPISFQMKNNNDKWL